MSTIPGDSSWADAGLVPPDSSEVPDPGRTTVPVPPDDQPRAPRPDLSDEAPEADSLEQEQDVAGGPAPAPPRVYDDAPEADVLEQQAEVPDDGSEDYPPG